MTIEERYLQLEETIRSYNPGANFALDRKSVV